MTSPQYRSYTRSPEWRKKSVLFRKYTSGRCAVFPWLKASDSHHLTYVNLKSEIYIRDCIPVSRVVHNFIHYHPIGLHWWSDIYGRRRWMNALFRWTTLLVTIAMMIWTPIHFLLLSPLKKYGILPLWDLCGIKLPKHTPKLKLKHKGNSKQCLTTKK